MMDETRTDGGPAHGLPEAIVMWRETPPDSDEWMWVIRHERSGVTTQGWTRTHAMLMLIDAMEGDGTRRLVEMAEDVFVRGGSSDV